MAFHNDAASEPDPEDFTALLQSLRNEYESLVNLQNQPDAAPHGLFFRYENPVLTAAHTPYFWRYDLDAVTNPRLLERMGINAVFNAGAIRIDGRFLLVARIESKDRKSFFAVAESKTGVDRFRFWDRPVVMPQGDEPDTNIFDLRLTQHEDGWIYGTFGTERMAVAPDEAVQDDEGQAGAEGEVTAGEGSEQNDAPTETVVVQCGLARTKDLVTWERLPNIQTPSPQQLNVVLHPELIEGRYGFYTSAKGSPSAAGQDGGIGWGMCEDITNPVLKNEVVMEPRVYHTIKAYMNGQGPPPMKTERGWLHLAHGVRETAAGLRNVLYMFLTDLNAPWWVTQAPGGYFMTPQEDERLGDVPNALFSNGWVIDDNGVVYIYYGASNSQLHVATTSVHRLLDYVENTPPDALSTEACVAQRMDLIERNLRRLKYL